MLTEKRGRHRVPLRHYLYTVRHLKLVQIAGKVGLVLRRKVFHRSSIYRSMYSPTPCVKQPSPIPFSARGQESRVLNGIAEGRFEFLNREASLGDPIDWLPATETQLWLYNLHYFDYVLSLAAQYERDPSSQTYELFRRLVSQWIRACPVATPVAWDSYPVSLRITNWIKAFTVFESAIRADEIFAEELLGSLYAQASFLEDNLEYHLLGNHLIENGRALLFAGLFFQEKKAPRWRRKGESILWDGLREQFVDDGGHYERSPMYHQLMLAVYLEVVSILETQGHPVPADVEDRLRTMETWLATVLHPDGNIPLLNDAALTTAGDPVELLGGVAGGSGGLGILPSSGYFTFRGNSKRDFLIFDCGPLGPDFQNGHGHCDAMSYELSVDGKRMIVDSGADDYYGDLAWRSYYRSTRAHNTVVVDGEEQSEIWSRFRVARRARPMDVRWSDDGRGLAYACGSHSGYRRLKGGVVHRRWVCWVDERFWIVCDQITGRGKHEVESLIHFHPDVTVRTMPLGSPHAPAGVVVRGGSTLTIIPWGVQRLTTYHGATDEIQGWYTSEMGLPRERDVWGLCRSQELPIWLGYVLWPFSTEASVDFSIIDEHSSRVAVQAAGSTYRVDLNFDGATVEIE